MNIYHSHLEKPLTVEAHTRKPVEKLTFGGSVMLLSSSVVTWKSHSKESTDTYREQNAHSYVMNTIELSQTQLIYETEKITEQHPCLLLRKPTVDNA